MYGLRIGDRQPWRFDSRGIAGRQMAETMKPDAVKPDQAFANVITAIFRTKSQEFADISHTNHVIMLEIKPSKKVKLC